MVAQVEKMGEESGSQTNSKSKGIRSGDLGFPSAYRKILEGVGYEMNPLD